MSYDIPDEDDFKEYFDRDFNYGATVEFVRDLDITRAIAEARRLVGSRLFTTQEDYTLGYLLMTAHVLCVALTQSSQGLSGSYSWLVNSRSVGSVSEGMTIPQRIIDNPEFAMLTKTAYGARYLALVLPRLVGQVFAVRGGTTER